MLAAIRSILFDVPKAIEIKVKKQAPIEIIIVVRNPALLPLISCSAPTSPPHNKASENLINISECEVICTKL